MFLKGITVFTVRPATLQDLQAITHIHAVNWQTIYRGQLTQAYLENDVFPERLSLWQQRIGQPAANQHILVACDNDTVTGFICLYLDHHPQWGSIVDNLHVDSRYKGQGIGAMLLNHAASVIHQQAHAASMYLEVLAANDAAQAFYQHMGGHNIHAQQWEAPEGSIVDEYVIHWPDAAHFLAA
ncbi:hypothetical protein ABT58_02940 [Photobacterium aphoticum]|uniref:N-acetyltransferase domain-containing protein n=1 Tax=Photobacterium aphoticum TaxID=754436 RepID=A0A0J1GRY9_9GAMM|nr:hypothetical protein ABT58_02940 [Photobacterium aphoticum]